MINPADVARRFAGHRPGFELVHFEEVGLPYYRLVLHALIQERRPIGPVEEFVLRAVEVGLERIDDVAGLLGLEREVVEQAVISLNQLDHVDYRLQDGERTLKMTPLGIKALTGWKEMRPRRAEVFIGFDRLTSSPTGKHFRELMRPKDAKAAGLRELPPYVKKRLRPLDIDLDQAQVALEDIARKSLRDAQLIGVKDVGNHQMVLPAVALVYGAEDGTDQQVAIAIDGRLSDEHETRFAEIEGPKRSGLLVEGHAHDYERPAVQLMRGLRVSDKQSIRVLEENIARANDAVHRAQTLTATVEASAEDTGESVVTEQDAVDALAAAEDELSSQSVRAIQTYEHRVLLEEALETAQDRLLLISQWIRGDVVDSQFIRQLKAALRRGVEVQVGWGIGDETDEKERRPLGLLRDLAREHSSLKVAQLANTDAKILIWDGRLVVTSFNWLSYKGDEQRGFRQEEGVLISASEVVEPEYVKYRSQILNASD